MFLATRMLQLTIASSWWREGGGGRVGQKKGSEAKREEDGLTNSTLELTQYLQKLHKLSVTRTLMLRLVLYLHNSYSLYKLV